MTSAITNNHLIGELSKSSHHMIAFGLPRQANPFFGLKDLQCITDATGGYIIVQHNIQ